MVAPPSSSAGGNKVRVVARIRPLSSREKDAGSHETISKLDGNGETALVQVNGDDKDKRWFELDAVLDGSSTQANVYEQSGAKQAITEDLFAGFNTSILAYGQTGAGKTHTMGTAAAKGDAVIDEEAGIIPRACADLFASIREKCESAVVTLSYLELYNEQIRDLFGDGKPASQNMRIRETPGGSVQVTGAVEKTVKSPADIGVAMEEASKKRVVAATAMNATSSRSHAICTLKVRGSLKSDDDTSTKFSSKLTLVDLAGSERIKKTGAAGARQAEGININKSLLVLGQVVSALSSPKGGIKPPYRDSKLTRLLQDSLGGNSRTLMVACVSPAHVNLDETTNTLRYAASARRITNKARQNVASVSTLTAEQAKKLQDQNASLQTQLAEMQKAMQQMQERLAQAQKEAADATTKRVPPNRTLTEATAAMSEDGDSDMDSFGDDVNGDEDEDEIGPKPVAVPDALKTEATPEQSDEEVVIVEGEEKSSPEEPLEVEEGNSKGSEITGDESSDDCNEGKSEAEEEQSDEEDDSDWLADSDDEDELGSLPEAATALLKKREANYFLNVSNHKVEIAELKARVDELKIMEGRNMDLQQELEEARAEAETARRAATYLSDIVDELRDIKRGEIEEKQQLLQMTLKEQNWISFVQVMLQNYRMQVGQLSTNFNKTVVRTIENLEFTEPKPETPEEEVAAGEESQEQPPVEKPKVSRRRSWWGGEVVTPQPPKILPWKESTASFEQEIKRIEEMLLAESESMHSIQENLAKDCVKLEREIGEKKLATESMFAGMPKEGNHVELVDQLSSILLQQKVPEGI
eukprot:scaffold9753_cov160-Amphora_coffeaeformis.AAC.5